MNNPTIGRKNYEIGSEFEKNVAELFRKMGYEVELNKRMIGCSGADYEIDIYGEKRGKFGKAITMAVECKYKNGQKVETEEVAVFNLKLDELRINEGYMVTNGRFSENAQKVARHYNIETIDGEELERLFKKFDLPYTFKNYDDVLDGPIPDAIRSTLELLNKLGLI
jgi:restriction endonuclease Mrr